jgi:putative ABC transport system permease protein
MTPRLLFQRVLALFTGRRLDRELDDEILAHLEMAERDARAAGLSPEAARLEARRQFGAVEPMKEIHRDRRGVRWLDTLRRDIRYGLAALGRDRGFALVAIGVLALGIGANAAMFSLVDAVFLKPLPFPHPERIVWVLEAPTKTSRNQTNGPRFLDWKRLNPVFSAFSVMSFTNAAAMINGEPAPLAGMLVSADYFDVFGIHAQIGRTFAPQDDQVGAADVVVLSHAVWQTRFGGDPGIINRDLVLDGKPHRVLGVLPAGVFDRDMQQRDIQPAFWKPLVFTPDRLGGSHWLDVVARMKPGVTLAQAQQAMLAVNTQLIPVTPKWKIRDGWSVAVDPFDVRFMNDTLRSSVGVAGGAVLLVLLIACANLANLLLTKGVGRQKEMAVRAALGASRGRLISQLLAESFVLCLIGAAAGLAVAVGILEAVVPLLQPWLPFTADVSIDGRVFAFAIGAAVLVSVVIGLLPALQTSTGALAPSLNQGARGSSGGHDRLRRLIVVGEVAISLVLICGAALLFKSLAKLQHVEAGVRVDHVITMTVDLPAVRYPNGDAATQFYESVVTRLQAVPGVEQATVSQDAPFQGVRGGEMLELPGSTQKVLVRFKRVDPHYFGTLDIPILAGRGFTDRDRKGAPRVAVINQQVATYMKAQFGIRDPIGQRIRLAAPAYTNVDAEGGEVQVVGIIRNERVDDPRQPVQVVVYVPLLELPRADVKVLVRTLTDPAALMPAIREAVRQIDPNLPLGDVRTLEQIKQRSLSGATEPTWVIGAFAGVAALLAALGLYGVLAHTVRHRRREIGIRMALGADASRVLTEILRYALVLVAIGLGVGFVAAALLTRVTKSLLFEVSALDPIAFASAGALMLLIGLLAAAIPAFRAAHVDPVSALRSEA